MSEQVEKLKLKGYDWLSDEQINHINEFKDLEKQLIGIVDMYFKEGAPDIDKRWMSISKTHFQEGFMAAVRSISKPYGD